MGYAILRTEKLNNYGSIGGSLNHTFRERKTPNANPEQLKDNVVLVGSHNSQDVLAEIKRRVNEITSKPRKNAVLSVELLLTFSPNSRLSLQEWQEDNLAWLKMKFGEKNVISAVLHRDETTPHIVAYVVPEVNNKLNCRELLGGRNKMSQLQTNYADSMKKHGLERGTEGSKAEHVEIKKYYSKLKMADKSSFSLRKALPEVKPPPEKGLFQSVKDREKELLSWSRKYNSEYDKVSKRYGKALLDTQMVKMENDNLKEENARLLESLRRLEQVIAFEDISKDDITVLRKMDISRVAERLGYTGDIKPKENAIDLVNRVNGFGFQDSVSWLYHEFGQDLTGGEVASYVNVKKPERPFSPAENKIKQEASVQIDALGCSKFRLTIQSETAKPYLPGKPSGKKSDEKFYTKEDIINMIPYLRYENNQGKNIFITPMDDNAYYILLDDCKKSLDQLEKMGFKPCLYQSTSWESHQAVFKIQKSDFDREKQVLPFFNQMNKEWGDPKMQGLRHAFRLAGFRNMKEKHLRNGERPFVEVQRAINRICSKCMEIIRLKFTKIPRNQTDLSTVPKP